MEWHRVRHRLSGHPAQPMRRWTTSAR